METEPTTDTKFWHRNMLFWKYECDDKTLEWKLTSRNIFRLFTILGAQPIFVAKACSAHFSGGLESVLVG